MANKDFYQILGVGESCSDAEVKSAYRKLAKKYHPDTAKDKKAAEEKFKEINEAYETLSDPQKKQQYDMLRKYGYTEGPGGHEQGPFGFGGGGGFGRGGQHAYTTNGPGGRTVYYTNMGGGGGPDLGDFDLNDLFGSIFEGQFSNVKRSAGARRPAYVEDEEEREEAIRGDSFLKKKGIDIWCEIKINIAQAVLGSHVKVRTLSGGAKLTIPPGTQSGMVFRLRGLGVKKGRQAGDQYVRVSVQIPTTLTDKQKKLFEEFAQEGCLRH